MRKDDKELDWQSNGNASRQRIEKDMLSILGNPICRYPIVICVDSPHLLTTVDVDNVNKFLQEMFQALQDAAPLASQIDMCLMMFSDKVNFVSEFRAITQVTSSPQISESQFRPKPTSQFDHDSVDDDKSAATLIRSNRSDIANGIMCALQLLRINQQDYSRWGIDSSVPMLVILSNGDFISDVQTIAPHLMEWDSAGKIDVVVVGYGKKPNVVKLQCLLPQQQIIVLGNDDVVTHLLQRLTEALKVPITSRERLEAFDELLGNAPSWAKLLG